MNIGKVFSFCFWLALTSVPSLLLYYFVVEWPFRNSVHCCRIDENNMNEYYYIILNKEKINYLFNTESIPEELAVHVDYEKYFYCKDVVVLQYLNSDSTVVNVKFRDENLKRIRNRIYSSTFEGYILKSNLRLELTQHLE